jgi:uncharacterized protein YndB with AHSA1/START domain
VNIDKYVEIAAIGFDVSHEGACEAQAEENEMNANEKTGIGRATGRERQDWFVVLDEWGAAGRPYREIADWLTREHGLSDWWAQKLIVEYEQERGLRPAGIRPDGTFSVGTSVTVAVPVERLYQAFLDPELREQWLPGAGIHERGSREGRSARFDWEADGTRLNADFEAFGEAKSAVAIEHVRLPDPATAETRKTFWRERLAVLKAVLEGHEGGAR